MYRKVFVCSPVKPATGGTELLQQLAYKLGQFGVCVYMYYFENPEGSPVVATFGSRYDNKVTTQIEDKEDCIVIVPEDFIAFLLKFKKAQKAVWWLSVDNYKGVNYNTKGTLRKIYRCLFDKFFMIKDKSFIHFVQSEYAYLYCTEKRKIPKEQVFKLSDYLNKTFIKSAISDKMMNREDNILYNPKKGIETTKQIIQLCPKWKFIPIQGMTSEQIKNIMLSSKVYIDFGNHPGKDRMPREAAICGMCVITGKRGAAYNPIDIPIPDRYKHKDNELDEIVQNIAYCINSFEEAVKDFDAYREKIKQEEFIFEEEIRSFFIQ